MNDTLMNDPSTALMFQDQLAPAAAVAQPFNTNRLQIDSTLDYAVDGPSEFVFLIHVANGMGQTLVQENLQIEPPTPFRTYCDSQSGNRFLRFQAQPGPLKVVYHALVDRMIEPADVNAPEVPVHELPDDVLHYLTPTRYCESDLLGPNAAELFGQLPQGYARVQAICEWVRGNIDYRIGSTNATTTAREVFMQRAGVCRDFAHLAVTFCRALNIPARLVSGYATFDEPPPDFHAVFEAYLGGRWVMFDPTAMSPLDQIVRLAHGRDAKDVAFATIFGPARMVAMSPDVMLLNRNAAFPG
ncbi:Transglutaminase-like [Polaromonas sp. CG9_12]|uniref:transglutaminase-like domain-containing protein n=1 Tax=Polaromonas sp. CG_9.11 TaxID=2787730 RepID=UPI0004DDD70F|nr:transglutaminase family protein [Polaromonas sp. CG_9.11]MBG6075230.1 transglutaminase-like putative cysteine protease [Polaromonas sp. CG_9.11]CDS53930.1 Transglutaminase-like [Polaromonas sp. CG9_12]